MESSAKMSSCLRMELAFSISYCAGKSMSSYMLRVVRSVRLKALSVNSVDVAFFLRITVRYFDKTQGNTYSIDIL